MEPHPIKTNWYLPKLRWLLFEAYIYIYIADFGAPPKSYFHTKRLNMKSMSNHVNGSTSQSQLSRTKTTDEYRSEKLVSQTSTSRNRRRQTKTRQRSKVTWVPEDDDESPLTNTETYLQTCGPPKGDSRSWHQPNLTTTTMDFNNYTHCPCIQSILNSTSSVHEGVAHIPFQTNTLIGEMSDILCTRLVDIVYD